MSEWKQVEAELKGIHKGKRILIYRPDRNNSSQIKKYSRWPKSITAACDHRRLHGAIKNTICIFELSPESGKELYAAVYRTSSAVATTSSRFKLAACHRIQGPTLHKLKFKASEGSKWKGFLKGDSDVIVPDKTDSLSILESLWKLEENRGAFESLLTTLRTSVYSEIRDLQKASIETSLAMIGLPREAGAETVDLFGEDSPLEEFRLHEDTVIEHDARSFPEMGIPQSDLTGRAVFRNGKQVLHVITANRRPLEECLGADLVIFNQTFNSVILVQYKMLDPKGEGWEVHLDDQFWGEHDRLSQIPRDATDGGYRLTSEAAYFKFVRRNASTSNHGYVVPLTQLDGLQFVGPKGGKYVREKELDSQHISHEVFCTLARTGYLGSVGAVSEQLKSICRDVLKSNRALTLAEVKNRLDTARSRHD